MPVSFLDLIPKPPTASMRLETASHGVQSVELSGVSLRDLAGIAKRFPAFARVLDGGLGSVMDHPDALCALVAASLGHIGEADYEAHVARFPSTDIIRLSLVVIALTLPRAEPDPLPEAVVVNGADAAASEVTSPLQLNS